MDEVHPAEEARPPRLLGWALAAVVACALFWGGLYLGSLEPWQAKLAQLEAAQAQAEKEMPSAQAERELAGVKQQLDDLERRWETTTAGALAQELEAHSVTLRSAQPGEEAGTFILEVEGSAHGLTGALPAWEKPVPAGRLPAVLYLRRFKRDPRLRARFRLEGVGRLTEWTLPVASKP